jgi:hypothetical protein
VSAVEFTGGVKRSRYPWDAIIVRTVSGGFLAGALAGALATVTLIAMLGFNLVSVLFIAVAIGGFAGGISSLVGLIVGAATWGALGLLGIGVPRRSAVAGAVPAFLLTLTWFCTIAWTGAAAALPAHAAIISVVVAATAVVLPLRMRRRFLDAIAADPGRVAGR